MNFDGITGVIFLLMGFVGLGFYDLEILFYILLIVIGIFLIEKVNREEKNK